MNSVRACLGQATNLDWRRPIRHIFERKQLTRIHPRVRADIHLAKQPENCSPQNEEDPVPCEEQRDRREGHEGDDGAVDECGHARERGDDGDEDLGGECVSQEDVGRFGGSTNPFSVGILFLFVCFIEVLSIEPQDGAGEDELDDAEGEHDDIGDADISDAHLCCVVVGAR